MTSIDSEQGERRAVLIDLGLLEGDQEVAGWPLFKVVPMTTWTLR